MFSAEQTRISPPSDLLSAPRIDEGWFTRERILTLALGLSTVLFLYLCFRLIETFIPAIAFAIALAVATQEPYAWLRNKLQKDTLAAVIGVVLVALLIIGPAAFLGTYAVQKAVENVNDLRSGGTWTDWRVALERQPILGPLLSWSEQHLDLDAQVQRIGEALALGGHPKPANDGHLKTGQ